MAFCVRCEKNFRTFVAATADVADARQLADLLRQNGAVNVEIIEVENDFEQEFQLLMAETAGVG